MTKWVAELNNGERIIEGEGDFKVIPGERKPWPRLVDFLKQSGLYVESISLDIGSKIIDLPKGDQYSIQYVIEAEIGDQTAIHEFIDIGSHSDGKIVHLYHNNKTGISNFVTTEGQEHRMVVSPLKT